MNILLDTHVWIWFMKGDKTQLKPSAIKLIENALLERTAYLASISVWELGMLYQKNRIKMNEPLSVWVERCCAKAGFNTINLENDVAIESTQLPAEFHGDPADRMLIATARQHGLTLITRDKLMQKYGKQGHLQVLSA